MDKKLRSVTPSTLRGLCLTRGRGESVELLVGGEVIARITNNGARTRLRIEAQSCVDVQRSGMKSVAPRPAVDRATFGGAA